MLKNQRLGISKVKELEQTVLFASKLHFLSVDTPWAIMCLHMFVYVLYIAQPVSQYTIFFCPVKAVVLFFCCFFCERRLRWHSFQISHHLSHSIASLHISNQSAAQLNLLQKFSLLRLTAIMEKYSMSNKHGWTWWVPLITGKKILRKENSFCWFCFSGSKFSRN